DAQGRPRGIVSESAVANGGGSVREHCVAVNAAVAIEDDLRAAVSTMFAHNLSVVPCVDGDGTVRGVLTFQAISRHLAILEARTWPPVRNKRRAQLWAAHLCLPYGCGNGAASRYPLRSSPSRRGCCLRGSLKRSSSIRKTSSI